MSHVLVIGHDPELCDVVLVCLESAGHAGACTTRAADGLVRARARAFDLVMVDVLAEHDADLATIRELRRLSPPGKILATAWSDVRPRTLLQAGASSTLEKPFDCTTLLGAVKALLEA